MVPSEGTVGLLVTKYCTICRLYLINIDIHNFGQFRHAEFDKNTFIDIWYHLKVPQACW